MSPELRPYQTLAVSFLAQHPRAGLFLDMGLGKTAVALSALTEDHLPALVVASKRVAENTWPDETALWRPDLRFAAATGSPSTRSRVLEDPSNDVVALGRDNLRDMLPPAERRHYRTLILDESTSFKSRESVRWKAAGSLINTQAIRHVWELTGTPTPNGLMDAWAPMYLLDRGERLGRNITSFRNRYFYPGNRLPSGVVTAWIPRPGAEEAIHTAMEDICLYMSSDGKVDMPPVTYNRVEVDLPPRVRKMYKTFKRDLVLDLEDLLGPGTVHTASSAAILTNRLRQVASGALYHDAELGLDGYDILHNEKIRATEEILEGSRGGVLLFYQYKHEKERLLRAFPQASTIDTPNVIRDWNAGRVPLLIAHPASAGYGLNLQHGGHTIIWFSLGWPSDEWEQGNKRLLRSGQQEPVIIHLLLARATVDEAIQLRLQEKISVQDALLSHLESPL